MKTLAIETSCDDTSVAIVEDGNRVLSSVVSSQIDLHSKYGGVVPEVAARAHIQNIIPVVEEALELAGEIKLDEIDYFAVTKGPGLIGSLIVGVNTARMFSYIFKKPLVAIHHTEGHIYANWLEDNLTEGQNPPEFPLICLTVSGGHTNIIYMGNHLNYQIIGQTIDDAAGEAFDKVAKMLGLGYPGGPIISKCAVTGCDTAYSFPRVDLTKKPERNEEGYLVPATESLNFSFSGIKTAVLKEVKDKTKDGRELSQEEISDIAASFQTAANEILTRNLIRAVKKYKLKSVLLSGGVAANKHLRDMLKNTLNDFDINFYFPKFEYCTDNAAMIAAAAYYHIKNNDFTDPKDLVPDPNHKLPSN